MQVRLAFHQAEDLRFVVTAAVFLTALSDSPSVTSQTLYNHEDSFLESLIAADLEDGPTQALAIAVILSVARPEVAGVPVLVDLTPEQSAMMGLNLRPQLASVGPALRDLPSQATHPFAFHANPEVFHDFLMMAPTPFVMLTGPEHTIAFINPPYVRILGRTSRDRLLGLPVLEAIPELAGQVCLELLDKTYRTGVPQVRREMLNRFRQEDTGLVEEVYFDIVYHPLRDQFGSVTGVMAQATDVTERVLARQVSEHREQKLYRLWAELEAIYHLAPVGLAVIDAATWTLLRLNRVQAKFLGGTFLVGTWPVGTWLVGTKESLTGAPLAGLTGLPPGLMPLLQQAAAGTPVKDVRIGPLPGTSPTTRPSWQVSVRPTLDAAGAVETLILISLELSSAVRQEESLCDTYLPVS